VGGDAPADLVHGPAGASVALDVGDRGGGADGEEAAFPADVGKAEAGKVDGGDRGLALHEMKRGSAGKRQALGPKSAQSFSRLGQAARVDEFR